MAGFFGNVFVIAVLFQDFGDKLIALKDYERC